MSDETPLGKNTNMPANDNDLRHLGAGFHYVELDADGEPANDNADDEDEGDIPWAELLERAGIDPDAIPVDLHRVAFEVSLCLRKGLTDPSEIANSLCLDAGKVRRALAMVGR